ncbi:MAG: hypothetical protein J6B24_01030 [Clostridia bacterium]|nr:hypothetical protein [Clostridia bacterium]
MSKKRRPYDPYSQKRNIRVPYTYFSRAAVKKQNRRFWGVGIPAIALAFATILLAGFAQESASPTVKESLYRLAIPLCALTAAALCGVFCFVIRKASKEGWRCTYSTMEQHQMEQRLPVLRTQKEQEEAGLGEGLFIGCMAVLALILVAAAIRSLCQ